MEIRVLGPVDVIDGDRSIPVPAGRLRELLLRLALSGGGAVSVEALVADLWPGSDDRTTTSTVRTYVARLRSVLPEDVVATRVGGYGLDRARVAVDAELFEEEVRTARGRLATDPGATADLLDAGLGRWRGPALADVADRDWAITTADRLEQARLDALELRAEAGLAIGEDPAGLAAQLGGLTAAHPLRERLWRHRILALYRAGRQADALACYQEVHALLRDELGIEPGAELRDLHRAVLAQDPGLEPVAVAALPPRRTRVAPDTVEGLTTTLVGRGVEREEVARHLATTPIVTVTGPGGVGKSRLAREVVADLAGGRTHGVAVVELAALSDATSLLEAMASSLDVVHRGDRSILEVIVDALDQTDTLLLLDNAEHLVEEVAEVGDAIADRAHGVRLLVTSRTPLAARHERVVPLASLHVPPDDADLETLRAADAVRLFETRARVVAPEFRLDAITAPVVARICRHLDGLPLAIELAAARARVLTPAQIEARLDERFSLLTGAPHTGRHETLREAVAWSYDLLGEDERRAFRRLSAFVGAFDVPGAAAVVVAEREDTIIDLLVALIDRSLLAVETHGAHVRYRMLETVRAFGREQLDAEGELVATCHRHAQHLSRAAMHAGELLHGPREAEGHALLVTLRDDLRAALAWCVVSGRWQAAARAVASVPWERVGRWVQWELATWAIRLVEENPPLDAAVAARIHGTAGVGYWVGGATDDALAAGDRALELARQADDESTYVEVALAVAWVRWEAGRMEDAAALYGPLADPDLGTRVRADVAAFCLGGMVMGMVESGMLGLSEDAVALAARLTDAALALADRSACPAAVAMAHLARAYSLLDSDVVAAREELVLAAGVEGLALPSWALHARAHLARFRAQEGDVAGLHAELADILTEALAVVDELHLRMLGGFVGGALALAGEVDAAPSLRPLAVEVATVAGQERWRREIADRLGVPPEASTGPPLAGATLERAVRSAIDDLARITRAVPST